MTSAIILLVIAGAAAIWMYRIGKAQQALDQAKSDLEGISKINEMNKGHDEKTDSILDELNSAPSLLSRKKRDR